MYYISFHKYANQGFYSCPTATSNWRQHSRLLTTCPPHANTSMTTYIHRKDGSACSYSRAAQYYIDLDFSQVMNCDKKPVIADLPPYLANDTKLGKLPYCCRNSNILPKVMDESKARSVFQLQVYKLPPDMNRTALNSPQK